jgi:hypothetical protein
MIFALNVSLCVIPFLDFKIEKNRHESIVTRRVQCEIRSVRHNVWCMMHDTFRVTITGGFTEPRYMQCTLKSYLSDIVGQKIISQVIYKLLFMTQILQKSGYPQVDLDATFFSSELSGKLGLGHNYMVIKNRYSWRKNSC